MVKPIKDVGSIPTTSTNLWFIVGFITPGNKYYYMNSINENIDDILELYKQGKSSNDIAKIYNVYPYIIIKILKQNNITLRKKGVKQGNIPWNKNKSFKIDNTLTTLNSENYKNLNEATIRRHIKRFLIFKNGHKCEICQNNKWNNQLIPLICDHIDGNSQNNNINNFRLVCPNCDAQLPTYKSRNRGNGRQYDRQYYQRK